MPFGKYEQNQATEGKYLPGFGHVLGTLTGRGNAGDKDGLLIWAHFGHIDKTLSPGYRI
jgi:hypothetical protein